MMSTKTTAVSSRCSPFSIVFTRVRHDREGTQVTIPKRIEGKALEGSIRFRSIRSLEMLGILLTTKPGVNLSTFCPSVVYEPYLKCKLKRRGC